MITLANNNSLANSIRTTLGQINKNPHVTPSNTYRSVTPMQQQGYHHPSINNNNFNNNNKFYNNTRSSNNNDGSCQQFFETDDEMTVFHQQNYQIQPPQNSNNNLSFHVNLQQPPQGQQKNWSKRILKDIIGLLHILSPSGKVLYCSESCIDLTGYHPNDLIGKSLTDFLHVDDLDMFTKNFQLSFSSLSRIKVHYRIRRKNNTYLLLESIGQPKQDVPNQPPQSFFAIAQPYLSRSNGLLDSFLELKMENEWLKKKLNEMMNTQQNPVTTTSSSSIMDETFNNMQFYENSAPPFLPSSSYVNNNSHTTDRHHYIQSNLNNNQGLLFVYNSPQQEFSRRPSNCSVSTTMFQQTNVIADDQQYMNNIESPSVASSSEFNEMLVRYHQEEQLTFQQQDNLSGGMTSYVSSNNSTNTSGTNNTAIDTLKKDKWKRRTKHRGVDDYVCADCGTSSSPEWRRGPNGPKTLCNACGLRWAKKLKKI